MSDPLKDIGQAVANVAASYDKSNVSSRNMLLSPEFWTDVAKSLRGETFGNMPEAVIVWPGVIILNPTSVETGSEDRKLNIMGSWFTMESRIVFDGVELETRMHGPDRLEAAIPMASEPATVNVLVRTGGHETQALTFTYTQAEEYNDNQVNPAGAEGRSAEDRPDRIGDLDGTSGGPAPVSEGGDEPDA